MKIQASTDQRTYLSNAAGRIGADPSTYTILVKDNLNVRQNSERCTYPSVATGLQCILGRMIAYTACDFDDSANGNECAVGWSLFCEFLKFYWATP